MTISYSEYLLQPVGNSLAPFTNVWVGMVSKNTGTFYKSDAPTLTSTNPGQFTYTTKPPGDQYTVYTSLTGTGTPPGGSWSLFADNWSIPVVQGENPSFQSATAQTIGPYTPTAPAGGVIAVNVQGLIHPKNRVVALGDSITVNGVTGVGPGVVMPFNGAAGFLGSHATLGSAATMGRLLLTGVFGASGKTTVDILSTYLPQVLALSPKPGICVLLIGTNDSGALTTTATYAVNVASIVSQLRDAGIEPIIGSIPPNNGGVAARDKLIREYNDFLQRFCAYNGVQFLDFYKLLVDPTTGQYRAGYNSDATHPSHQGYWVMGTAYRGLNMPNFLPWLTGDTADAHNLILNGTFAGGGAVGTSWSVGIAGAGYTDSLITGDPGILGNWQQTLGTSASQHQLVQSTSVGFSPGDVIAFSCLMQQLNTGNSGVLNYGQVKVIQNPGSIQQTILSTVAADFGPVLIYQEFVVQPSITSLQISLLTNQICTVRWAQVTLINLTTAGIASISQVAS